VFRSEWCGFYQPDGVKKMIKHSAPTYRAAIADLRSLLAKIGRAEFRAYGYSAQLRQYRADLSSVVAA
jgi:hypothetical protein